MYSLWTDCKAVSAPALLNKALSKPPLQTFKRKAELEEVNSPSCSGGGSGDTALEECQLEFRWCLREGQSQEKFAGHDIFKSGMR